MKKILIVFALFGINIPVFSQGVDFQTTTIENAFRLAKTNHKALFIEIYSPTCHVCQSFMPVFAENSVGSFFNQHFVNVKIDMDSPEYNAYFRKDKTLFLGSIPLMLFFDENGKFIHHVFLSMGQDARMLVMHGERALDAEKRTGNYKKMFNHGMRDMAFLSSYSQQCRLFCDTLTNNVVVDELYKKYPKNQMSSQQSWEICRQLVLNTENPFFQYWINNVSTASKYSSGEEKKYFEHIILGELFSSQGKKFNVAQISKMEGYLAKIGFTGTDIQKKTMLPMTFALLKEGKTKTSTTQIDNYLKTGTPSSAEIVYWVKIFNENAKDVSYKDSAISWLKSAVARTSLAKDRAEVHFQSAKLYRRVGDMKQAEKAADLALKNAEIANLDLKRFKNL